MMRTFFKNYFENQATSIVKKEVLNKLGINENCCMRDHKTSQKELHKKDVIVNLHPGIEPHWTHLLKKLFQFLFVI